MSHFNQTFRDKNTDLGRSGTPLNARSFGLMSPSVNASEKRFLKANPMTTRGLVVAKDTFLKLIIDDAHLVFDTSQGDVHVDDARDILDAGVTFDSGCDYYVYLVHSEADDFSANLIVSKNSTYPTGFTAMNSRKIGGFHTLCRAIPSTEGHSLGGYQAGDILPNSVWCLTHRPWPASPEGMSYCSYTDAWYDIYLQSGTGVNTRSVFGATITDTRAWDDHNEDLRLVGKSLLTDGEFSIVMEGSNQQTEIKGSVDPVTTGGHEDTVGRRMVSNIGLEDGCGAMWQWLDFPSANGGSSWGSPTGKGSVYGISYTFLAGGNWGSASYCGSRCRHANAVRSITTADVAGRGRARNI